MRAPGAQDDAAQTNEPAALTRADTCSPTGRLRSGMLRNPAGTVVSCGSEKLQIKIGGMACSFCVASITRALGRMEGVCEASVNLAHEEALVVYDPTQVTPAELKNTLLDLGYTVRDANKERTFEEEEAELR